MDWIPLALGGLALALAFVAHQRASGAISAAEDAKREAQRRVSTLGDELRSELHTLRKLMAKVASGETLTAAMIEDGQLWRDIDGDEARRIVDEAPAAFVLDVRTPQETALGVVRGATLIPMDDIEDRKGEIPRDGRPILVYCAAGSRSAAVCEHLSREGLDGLLNLEGGFGLWTGATESPTQP